MIAYLTEQGAKIVRQGRRILVQTENLTHTLFCWKLEQVCIFGNITLTQPALALLLEEGIDVVFFKRDGRYLGRFASDEPKNVFLRNKQFALANDPVFCLNIAKNIVAGKLQNQATLLSRIKRVRNIDEASIAAKIVRDYAKDAIQATSIEQLRGIEGIAANKYFSAYRFGFLNDFGFNKRVRRPPTDPINAVLSLGYTLLINRVYAAIRQVNLDPYPAVLHTLEYGRQSLALDLVEEFRPLVVDTLTLALFNLKILGSKDFEIVHPEPISENSEQDPLEQAVNDSLGVMSLQNMADLSAISDIAGEQIPSAERPLGKLPVLLTRDAFKRVVTGFAKKLDSKFYHPIEDKELSYYEAIVAQAKQYRRLVEGEKEHYQALLLR